MIYRKYLKRLLDILIGASVLIILSPVLLITALLIKLESPGPVIFKQKRIGYKSKNPFSSLTEKTLLSPIFAVSRHFQPRVSSEDKYPLCTMSIYISSLKHISKQAKNGVKTGYFTKIPM